MFREKAGDFVRILYINLLRIYEYMFSLCRNFENRTCSCSKNEQSLSQFIFCRELSRSCEIY